MSKAPQENLARLEQTAHTIVSLAGASGSKHEQVVGSVSFAAGWSAFRCGRSVLRGCAGWARDAVSRRKVCDQAWKCCIFALQAGERCLRESSRWRASLELPQPSG